MSIKKIGLTDRILVIISGEIGRIGRTSTRIGDALGPVIIDDLKLSDRAAIGRKGLDLAVPQLIIGAINRGAGDQMVPVIGNKYVVLRQAVF